MYNRLLLLAAAVLISACADDQHATAPNSPSARSGAAADLGPAGQTVKAAGKPTDQVGLTTVFSVVGTGASMTFVLGPTPATATCPAGSQAIGGGYAIGNWAASRYLAITQMGLDGANGWKVTAWVFDQFAPAVSVSVWVTCIK
jgi:hypothetical protein